MKVYQYIFMAFILESGINVYGVHDMAGVRKHSKGFYEEISSKTGDFLFNYR